MEILWKSYGNPMEILCCRLGAVRSAAASGPHSHAARPLSFESHTCVQQPGDLLWIPDHWHHAVVSRDETFGVAYQGRSTSPPPEMYAWMAGVLLALASLIAAVVWWCCCRGKAAAETRAAFK